VPIGDIARLIEMQEGANWCSLPCGTTPGVNGSRQRISAVRTFKGKYLVFRPCTTRSATHDNHSAFALRAFSSFAAVCCHRDDL